MIPRFTKKFNPYLETYMDDWSMQAMFNFCCQKWFGMKVTTKDYKAFCLMCKTQGKSFTVKECAKWMSEQIS